MLLLLLSDVLMVTAVRIRRSEGSLPSGATSSRHTLVFGRSAPDLDHDAAMRIGGEASGRRHNLYPALASPPPSRDPPHPGPSSTVRRECGEPRSCVLLQVGRFTPPNAKRSLRVP